MARRSESPIDPAISNKHNHPRRERMTGIHAKPLVVIEDEDDSVTPPRQVDVVKVMGPLHPVVPRVVIG